MFSNILLSIYFPNFLSLFKTLRIPLNRTLCYYVMLYYFFLSLYLCKLAPLLTLTDHFSLSLETVDSVQSCQFLDDRILQCIKQYADKIKSGILNTSKLLKELLSWKVLSTEDYTTCFSSRNFLNEAVDYVIRHLIQEKNRVKTRIFLHVLSELKEVEPKLAAWIQKLNSFGNAIELEGCCLLVGRLDICL